MIELRLVVSDRHEIDPPRLQYRVLYHAYLGGSGNIELLPLENPPVWMDVPIVVVPTEEKAE
jgi:hypothetical protein